MAALSHGVGQRAVEARDRQEHGGWPRTVALSAWGTANMRTGGDDIAQALALLGVQPTWETASRRLKGFEIIPESVLDRPRVDVTLRISATLDSTPLKLTKRDFVLPATTFANVVFPTPGGP